MERDKRRDRTPRVLIKAAFLLLFLGALIVGKKVPAAHHQGEMLSEVQLARFVRAAYDLQNLPEKRWSYSPLYAEDDKTPYGFVAIPPPDKKFPRVVALRGTVDEIDWLHNLIAHKGVCDWSENQGRVHVGFCERTRKIEKSLRSILKQTEFPIGDPRRSVIYAGHSMGGAVASILAMRESIYPVKRLVTFGVPFVGDQVFVSVLTRRVPLQDHFLICMDLISLSRYLGDYIYADGQPFASFSTVRELLPESESYQQRLTNFYDVIVGNVQVESWWHYLQGLKDIFPHTMQEYYSILASRERHQP